MEHNHIGKHLNILHKCPHCDRMFTLFSLKEHYRNKDSCSGKIYKPSKKFYNENKNIETLNILHPQNFLQFFENFDLDQFLQPNKICYYCSEKGCDYYCDSNY